jgi:histidine triad (HIT) family protein
MDDCIFCKVAAGEAPSWKVLESDAAYAFLDIHPVNAYHTLVIPKLHYRNIFDIPTHELQSLMSLLKRVVDLYAGKLHLTDVQIINSSGADAQQDVFHLHFHIVPRHAGDGQNIVWKTHPQMRSDFDEMLARLKQ